MAIDQNEDDKYDISKDKLNHPHLLFLKGLKSFFKNHFIY